MTLNKTRRALGRGLASLIPLDSEEKGDREEIINVQVSLITVNPFQPRKDFKEEEIQSLAESIKKQGLLQPVVVRRVGDGYEIISGERRFRAMCSLGYATIPCWVKNDIPDDKMLELALVENIQRENLNEIELALAYQKLLFECGLSHQDLSERIGKSRTVITNTLRLLKLPEDLQKMLRDGTITMGHARALLSIEDPAQQRSLVEKIIADELSVRDIEKIVQSETETGKNLIEKSKSAVTKKKKETAKVDPDLQSQQDLLRYRFGTDVKITMHDDHTGVITINFFGDDDFNRIVDMLADR